MQSLGILGVGELTEKLVRGLRRSGYAGTIRLSPRNAERAAMLAQECACEVMADNQSLVEGSEAVILGVRPDALHQVAREVTFRPNQLLVSLAAGVDLQRLADAFPAARVVRGMLSYAAQINQTTVVLCPPDRAAGDLLQALGSLVVLEEEPAFELATVAACMNGWFYFFLDGLQQWLGDRGLPAGQARALVLGNMQDCVASAMSQPDIGLKALGQTIATPGTYTAEGAETLDRLGAGAAWAGACDQVLARLSGRT